MQKPSNTAIKLSQTAFGFYSVHYIITPIMSLLYSYCCVHLLEKIIETLMPQQYCIVLLYIVLEAFLLIFNNGNALKSTWSGCQTAI